MPRLTLAEPEAQARLAGFIAGAAGGPARILEALPLKGGAIQENWLVTAEIGGEVADMVLRTDAPTGLAVSHGRAQEFAILRAAHAAGVCVPEPLWLCRDPAVLGRDFYLMRRIAGVAQGHRVVKDKSLGGDRAKLAERLGARAGAHPRHPPRRSRVWNSCPCRKAIRPWRRSRACGLISTAGSGAIRSWNGACAGSS